MNLKEQVDLLIPEKSRKKKFKDITEKEWTSAIVALEKAMESQAVTQKTVEIKKSPGATMFNVLAKKNAEVMVFLENADMENAENRDTLQDWLKNCVTYSNNLDSLKKSGNKGSAEDDEDDEPKPKKKNNFISPESFAKGEHQFDD